MMSSKNRTRTQWFKYRAAVAPTPVAESKYPPLPKRLRSFFCTKCGSHQCQAGTIAEKHPPCAKCSYLGFAEDCNFTEAQMHAYIDADRESRVVSRPQLATPAAGDVLAERQRQIDVEQYDFDHDDEHPGGEIAALATFYAMPPAVRDWEARETGYGRTWGEAILPADWTVPKTTDRRRELVKAGALILAEIERLDRATATQQGDGQ